MFTVHVADSVQKCVLPLTSSGWRFSRRPVQTKCIHVTILISETYHGKRLTNIKSNR